MPATEYHGSSVPFASLGRSLLSIRREQVHSMDPHQDDSSSGSIELDSFQKHVADLFQDLSGEDLLSLSWIRKLLEAFLVCQEEFRAILVNNGAAVSRPPLDRHVAEFFERSVKALDVCNAIRDGIEQIRQFHKYLEIVQIALNPNQKSFGEGQLRRAKKALTDLTIAMIDEKESGPVVAHRNRSFGRTNTSKDSVRASSSQHSRSLSWSVSRSWSAVRQLQAISNNLQPPRSNEITASNGITVAVYTMNCVLLFVMSSLVAAIPCQDRGLQTHFSPPRNYSWAGIMISLHEKILEESKKRERRNSCGLMKEMYEMEVCSRNVAELADPAQMGEEREAELRMRVHELSLVCDSLKKGLVPLERQVRDVFHRIVRSRTDGLDCSGQ